MNEALKELQLKYKILLELYTIEKEISQLQKDKIELQKIEINRLKLNKDLKDKVCSNCIKHE
jgi:hypothetical protein